MRAPKCIPLVVVASILFTGLGVIGPAQAQQAISGAPSSETQAQKFYNTGLEAARKERWPEAAASFSAAWELEKGFQIAGALGHSELRCQRYRDAAEHLEAALRLGKDALRPKDRKALEEWSAQARAHVATLTVTVGTNGATVVIEGRPVGTSPLTNPVFVEPGTHRVEAQRDGYEPAGSSVKAIAGRAYELSIPMLKSRPKVNEGTNAEHTTATGGDGGARIAVTIVGVAVGTFGIALGGVFMGSALSKGSDKEDISTKLDQEGHTSDHVCNDRVEKDFATSAQCKELVQLHVTEQSLWEHSAWLIPTGVAIAGGTLVYAFMAPKHSAKSSLRVMPAPTAKGGGLLVIGTW